jgi:hypothetical protein
MDNAQNYDNCMSIGIKKKRCYAKQTVLEYTTHLYATFL